MMENMIERVALAMARQYDPKAIFDRTTFIPLASAAIEAMRDPTVSMLTAGEYADSESNATGNATNIWRDMIDAALHD